MARAHWMVLRWGDPTERSGLHSTCTIFSVKEQLSMCVAALQQAAEPTPTSCRVPSMLPKSHGWTTTTILRPKGFRLDQAAATSCLHAALLISSAQHMPLTST
jgi:hypothetical protein